MATKTIKTTKTKTKRNGPTKSKRATSGAARSRARTAQKRPSASRAARPARRAETVITEQTRHDVAASVVRHAATCRRCTDCVGQDHHWIENCDFENAGDPEFQCKHCSAYCDAEEDPDTGLDMPSGVVRAWMPDVDVAVDFVPHLFTDEETARIVENLNSENGVEVDLIVGDEPEDGVELEVVTTVSSAAPSAPVAPSAEERAP